MPRHGLTMYDPQQACQGYTLYTPMTGSATYLIDMQGAIAHRWVLPGQAGTYGYLLNNGNLLVNVRSGEEPLSFGGRGARVVELDWDGTIVWEYADAYLHHDFCRMPNGDTMVLGWERVPDVIAAQVQGGLPGTEHEQGIWCDYFRQVTMDQQVVWEWHGYQHLDVNTEIIAPLYQRHEWTHANTCEVLPDGNVLTSFRTINMIGIIDRQSDAFTWKWGHGELGGQHDPNPLPNGHILLFDNGWHSRRGAPFPTSRVLEVDPQTDEIVWCYETKPGWAFFSSFISGAQRLDNGNTLICEGMRGRIFEVTPSGEIVWQFVNPFYGYSERFGNVNIVFRAYRYSAEFAGFQNKTMEPQAHAWLNHLYMR